MALMNGFLQVGLLQLCNLLAKIVKSGADGVNGAGSDFLVVLCAQPEKGFRHRLHRAPKALPLSKTSSSHDAIEWEKSPFHGACQRFFFSA